MIEILIMDDSDIKIKALKSLLIDECKVPADNIRVASSINAGRNALIEQVFDLLLLDLVMPNFDDGEADDQEGPKFIDEIYCNPNFKIPNQIIGLTEHDDQFENLKSQFEDKLWYLIHFQQSNINWRSKIRSKVFHLLRNKERIEESILNRDKYDLGIICALNEEYISLLEAFDCNWEYAHAEKFPMQFRKTTITTAFGNTFKICAICVGRAGMVSTSILATCMYDILKVDTIFMTGFSAGIHRSDLHLGDIIVARSVQDYSVGKLITDEEDKTLKLLKEIQQIQAPIDLTTLAGNLISDCDLMNKLNLIMTKKHLLSGHDRIVASIAPTVCGPFVVASAEAIKEIQKDDRKLSALDMEGFGLYYAAHIKGKKCLWIKAIADFADEHKGDEFHTRCSYASGLFLYLMIKEIM